MEYTFRLNEHEWRLLLACVDLTIEHTQTRGLLAMRQELRRILDTQRLAQETIRNLRERRKHEFRPFDNV